MRLASMKHSEDVEESISQSNASELPCKTSTSHQPVDEDIISSKVEQRPMPFRAVKRKLTLDYESEESGLSDDIEPYIPKHSEIHSSDSDDNFPFLIDE